MDTESFAAELELAKRLAREAGAVILRHYAGEFTVEYKGHADPVTQADKDANQVIVEGLRAAFPGDAVLAEESPPDAGRRERRRLWCVDPLDGTREFVDRNGQFVVMIGLAVDGEARLGVVYQPTEDLLYYGCAGQAWRQRAGGAPERLRPTRVADPAAATMVSSRSHRSKSVERLVADLAVARQEHVGSVGLKMARVAEGTAELYLSMSTQTHEWDACAPEALLRAAGGLVTDARGEPLRYNKQTTETPYGMLATNGPLHPAALRALAPQLREHGWA